MLKIIRYLTPMLFVLLPSCLKQIRHRGNFPDHLSAADTAPDFGRWLKQISDSLNIHLSDTFCILQQPFSKAQPESGMTNWMADAVVRKAQTFCSFDACVLSYELLSCAYLPPGPICRRDMYRLVEQDDALGILELDGRQLQLLCDSIASGGGIPLSGIQFSIAAHKAVKVRIKEKVLHPDLVYRILLNKGLLQSRSMPACVYRNKYWRFCCPSVRYLLISDLENTLPQQTLLKNSTDQRISYDD